MPTVGVTGQAVVNASLTMLGILEQGGTPSASESQDSLNELNSMWNAWGIDEGLIFAESTDQYALTQNVGVYPIGPSAAAPFNVPLPSRIYRATYVTPDGRNQLDVVNADEYFKHNDLLASAVAPDELYPDFNPVAATGTAILRLWPVPNVTSCLLELNTGAPFTTWALNTTYFLPQGYQDAVQYALAWRLIPRFGLIVPQQIAQEISMLGEKAELRIREMNKVNRRLVPGTEMLVPPQVPGAPRA